MCVLIHKHRRRGSGVRGGHHGNLVSSGPAPEQERLARAADPMLAVEAGGGPGAAGGGAPDFRVLGTGGGSDPMEAAEAAQVFSGVYVAGGVFSDGYLFHPFGVG